MRLWRIPEDGGEGVPDAVYRTEWVVMAETQAEAVALLRAHQEERLRPYPTSQDWALYDEIEELTDPVYSVPMYGYSW